MRFSKGRNFLFRVEEGKELVEALTKFMEENNVLVGNVSGIGTLKNPKIAYFERDKMEYRVIQLDGDYEVVSLLGNVSLKDGRPFVHLHVALGDSEGRVYGGHLVQGETFVMEVFVQELLGEPLERKPKENGLTLWDV